MRSTSSSSRPGRRTVRALLAAVLAVAAVGTGLVGTGLVGTAEPAAAATAVWKGTVPAGTTLRPGDSVTSPNGQFRLVMQGDGNLVEYGIANAVIWASGTDAPGAVAVIGKNRAVDLVRGSTRIARWAQGGTGQSTSFEVRGDGTMALLVGTTAIVNWNGYQDRVPAGSTILPGTTLRSGPTNANTLTMMANGVFVQRNAGKNVWLTNTVKQYGATAAVQQDGNLVVYSKEGKALWASNTSRKGGGALLVQVDGNVVLYGKDDSRSWSTRRVTGLAWPVVGTTITGRFGDDRGAGHNPRYHQGADAPVRVGTPVYGSGTGTVTTVVKGHAAYGNYVVVTYGMTSVLSAHLSTIAVKKGQVVQMGTRIAASGNTGQSTGPHLHVEVRQGNTLVDPLKVLKFR
ncbi:peptidoglycan DD-metalloendopeptidase family protein [Curtobacterium sp. MCBD17_032]|uniref:peptidoglycan DD-metalloendopeptidase family protein n=1 Tax=Curtobacterium sp. MCBD17_032 TaxID=2175659 RepID=UPI0015E89F44|nr:peptidoglycan DD-metalloendopeptidase family protein [Curtobacterium sp. MCBD17_032]